MAALLCGSGLAGTLTFEEPAPGRTSGRVYYYVPDGLDLSRPVPLFVFQIGRAHV